MANEDWTNYIVITVCTVIFTIVYSRVVPLYMTEKKYLIGVTAIIVVLLVLIRVIINMRNKNK